MAMTREEREAKLRRQASLAALPKHPSWPDYIEAHVEEVAWIEDQILRHCRRPEPVSQRQIDFWRGCLSVLRWQIRMPLREERDMIRYLKSQGVKIEEEEYV